MATRHSNVLLDGLRKRIIDRTGDGIQNVWFNCKGELALDRLRYALRYDPDDYNDILFYSGLLTTDGKFQIGTLSKGTMLEIEDRTFHSKISANERWIRFVSDRLQIHQFATDKSARKLAPGDKRLLELEEHFYAQTKTSPT